jgi:outer membrane protein assembly factor BamB
MKNFFLSAILLCGAVDDADQAAKEIVAASGVSAGLVVQVGCGDGRLAGALLEAGRFVVHGLDAEPERARETLRRKGVYGRASVDRASGASLPYSDNLVNLLVVEDFPRAGVAMKEILRVLAPRGAAVIGRATEADLAGAVRRGTWLVIRKPVPAGIDDWTHASYDAGGRGASRDTAFGPLHGVRWIAGPEWPLGTYYQVGNGGMVAAGGRLFSVTINAAANLSKEPDERDRSYHLVARDAHNGLFLWSRPLPHPSPREGTGLADALVAGADRVFVAAGGSLLALDAATGENEKELAKAPAESRLALRGERLVLGGDKEIRGFDAKSGAALWTHPSGATDLLIDESRVFAAVPGHASMASLDLETGRKRWEADLSAQKGSRRKLLYAGDGIVVFVGMGGSSTVPGTNWIHVRSAEDGKELWTRTYSNPRAHWPDSVHFIDGLVWLRTGNDRFEACDPRTGERRREFTFKGSFSGGCMRDIATDRYLIATRPLNLIDLKDGTAHEFRGGRHACRAGVAVANGMLYTMPHGCKCVSSSLRGFLAFAPRGSDPGAGEPELVRGSPPPTAPPDEPDVWPTFRYDARRTGRTPAAGPAKLRPLWEARLDGGAPLPEEWLAGASVNQRLTGPVIAGGVAVVSVVNAHRVAAVDARTGEPRWTYTAGGRIDSPPTLFRGLCLFGSRDGWVTALRVSDGALVWRFRAAPADRRIVAFGQVESAWPVTGGVMVDGGRAFAIAGRSAVVDGGMVACALTPETGGLLWRTPVTEGDRSDVGVSDGESVFLGRLLKFDAATGKPQKGGTQGLWAGSSLILDHAWETLSADDRALHWMRVKQGFGDQPAVTMNHIQHTFQPGEGSLVVAAPERKRAYAYRVAYIHWGVKKDQRNEHAGALHAWEEKKERWTSKTDFQVESLVLAGDRLYAGGALDRFRRKPGGKLSIVSAEDGKVLLELPLDVRPVSDGLAVANGRLYVSLEDGRMICYGD